MAASEAGPPPVHLAREAPYMDARAAARRLRAAGHEVAVLDGQGAHPDAGRSFVAVSPSIRFTVRGDRATEERGDGWTETVGDPLRHLRALLDATRQEMPEPDGFTGGWVGFLGYEAAALFDPTFPRRPAPDGLPDAELALFLDALVLDHRTRSAVLHCADLDGDLRAATLRMALLSDALTAPLPSLPSPPSSGDGSMPHRAPPLEPVPWETSLDEAAFCERARSLQALIHDGDHFQSNLAVRSRAPCGADPVDLLDALAAANPSPFGALWEGDGYAIVSNAPERLVRVAGGAVSSRPIAGTRKRGATPEEDEAMEAELRADAKERAEHTMLVDLVRNDVARCSVPGSVAVPESMSVERYRHVMHLASRVEGRLRPGAHVLDVLGALFPGGTVTGAPKHRACLRIQEAEPVPRGPYTGSLGYVGWAHQADWNILIRTLVLAGGAAAVHAGSGIVAGSEPRREWREAGRKAQALLDAATGRAVPGGTRLGEVTRHGSWAPPRRTATATSARVLIVDNVDSFVHNLADYAAALGAATRVVPNSAAWREAVADFRPTHVVLSPGPGWPSEAGCTPELARELHGRLPLLGVCLGHQAIGAAHGGRVVVKGPVHGHADAIHHAGEGLFEGLPNPLRATRYHSLVVDEGGLGADWAVDARLADGTVMALRHRRHPTYGLQFHPESLCTEAGLELLARFLGQAPP